MRRKTRRTKTPPVAERLKTAEETGYEAGYAAAKRDQELIANAAREIPGIKSNTSLVTEHHGINPNAGQGMATFDTGATRDLSDDKFDFEGFLSPTVIEAFAAYMHANRTTAAGQRASDNWQKGIPFDKYMKALWRHFHAAWKAHRKDPSSPMLLIDLMGIMFNAQGYAHEYLKKYGITGAEVLELATLARQQDLAKRGVGPSESPVGDR
jgi:hypothetical protein